MKKARPDEQPDKHLKKQTSEVHKSDDCIDHDILDSLDDDASYSDPEVDQVCREMFRDFVTKVGKSHLDDFEVTDEMQQSWTSMQKRFRAEGIIPESDPLTPLEAQPKPLTPHERELQPEFPTIRPERHTETKPLYPQWIGWVAAACITLVVGVGALIGHRADTTDTAEWVAQAESYEVISTQDKASRVKTSDGSYIHLNRHTTIAYNPKSFNREVREIWIYEGEAFFDVAKNPDKPFIVYTANGLKTTVRGTSFNVRSYKALSKQEVSVRTGLVTVEEPTGKKALHLTASDRAVFAPNSSDFYHSTTNADEVGAWRDGQIFLDDVTWDEYAYQIMLYYGYTIQTRHDDLHRITGLVTTFNLRHPVTKAIQGVTAMYGLKYKIDEGQKTITIY